MIRPALNCVAKAYEGFQNGVPTMASFSRASGAWRTNAKGFLEYTQSQIARHDYSPSTGEYLGWLLEGPSTNLLLYSDQCDAAAWVKSNGTVSANTSMAPDRSISADTFTASGADASIGQSFTPTSSTTYTASVWLRVASGTRTVRLILRRVASWTEIASIDASLTTTWKRVSVTGGVLDTTTHQFCVSALPSGASIEVWGGQIEQGKFPSSYISTGGTVASRAADIFALPIPAALFTASGGGTAYIMREVLGYKNFSVGPQLDDGTDANLVQVVSNGDLSETYAYGWSSTAPGIGYGTVGYALPPGSSARCALTFSFAAQTMALAINGTLLGESIMRNLDIFSTLRVTGAVGGNYLDGHVRHVALFSRAFSASDLQLLTTERL